MHVDPGARLRNILRALVRRSFPNLRQRPIAISWAPECGLLDYTVQPDHHLIRVDDCLRKAPRPVLEGGIAHELCHIDADLKMGPYQRELAWSRYARSRWCRMREERATERRVIELGYGPQLLALIRYAHRLGHSFSREDGLLYAEVHRAMVARKISDSNRYRRCP
jgi:hypothetical protein